MSLNHAAVSCAVLLLMLLKVQTARACLVCVADPLESVLIAAVETGESVVLARPAGNETVERFEILSIIRSASDLKPGTMVEATLPMFSDDGGRIGREEVLLTRAGKEDSWVIRAPASDELHCSFYERVSSLPRMGTGDPLAESIRMGFFVGFLHHEDDLLAKAAAVELTKAPYPSLKAMKSRLDADALRQDLKNPVKAGRFPLFNTLLGICGNDEDAARFEAALERMWDANASLGLGAMLTAYLERGGEAGLEWIHEHYFLDDQRTLPEIEQAVLALRLHGNADDSIERERMILAYRRLIEVRERLAFLVIEDLARWNDWESRELLVAAAARHGDNIPELRHALNGYLMQCPPEEPDKAD